MGSQMLSSDRKSKDWIVNFDPNIQHMPFSDEADGAEAFERHLGRLRSRGVEPQHIAGFVLEGYQGIGGAKFYPAAYVQALRRWADVSQALVIFDEIQSGIGRTGKFFAYEHYDIDADLVCCGKGLGCGLPLAVVLGPAQILDLPEPGALTSTHTANPLGCAAGLATLEVMERENLVLAAAQKGPVFEKGVKHIWKRHPQHIAGTAGRGMVDAIYFIQPGTGEPDRSMAHRVTDRAVEKGVMLFHTHGNSVKMGPPLMIPSDALCEGIEVLGDAVDECLGSA